VKSDERSGASRRQQWKQAVIRQIDDRSQPDSGNAMRLGHGTVLFVDAQDESRLSGGQALMQRQPPCHEACPGPTAKFAQEQFRFRIVQVQHNATASIANDSGSPDKKGRDIVHLYDMDAPSSRQPRKQRPDPQEEAQIRDRITKQAASAIPRPMPPNQDYAVQATDVLFTLDA